ncbi:MAG: hypothetical protein HC836_37515 [Richelia sp. RM2_1_2]|uniref:DUF6876 domain-containing protein n=1 Tax=Plectonema cf. radiosum LEGE 06105 TaxID=945769 RepID=A0A8J7F137_9CYAN|nr:DUF6876 family protein [Plectonema radiosum]MBE9212822.1 hypothetical protein [Plectonema cf. radiosum LEGE 06105]NJN11617.1 hypothetical protein [Richelia sp. RM1_1_1]NJO63685.1 hypothetical protein [Richelia sp. RM2_1_2]
MKTSQEIATDLKKFYGSVNLYKHWLGLRYTDGIQYLAKEANCYWLLDAIASHQTKNLLSNPRLREFQIWHLRVKENSGILICEWDTNQEVLRQEIEYTDFPLSHIKLYLVEKVLMLPSEY